MKKLISAMLTLCILTTMSFPAFAADNSTFKFKEVGDFDILESQDAENRVTRVYERNNNSTRINPIQEPKNICHDETKKLLFTLGMEKAFIDKLSDEDLEIYATSPQIIGTVSYAKLDAQNNITYLSEDMAIQESAELNQKLENLYLNNSQIQPFSQNTYEDSYMRIFYMVTYLGNGNYKFSTDARWLTMPFFRGKDSVGACAQTSTVTNSTRSGWYEYDITHINNGKATYDSYYGTIKSGAFKNAINGNWYGSAGIIDLPNDTHGQNSSTLYNNFKAHYEYHGHLNNFSLPAWFSTTGSYSHATIAISFTPSVKIGLKGASGSIGLDITPAAETRSAELEIYHDPAN